MTIHYTFGRIIGRKMWRVAICYLAAICAVEIHAEYNVGVGIGDVTGPAAEINFMGYASLEQSGEGIHLRQFSRAYVFEEQGTRFVFVCVEIQGPAYAVKQEVVKQLNSLYGPIYNIKNVIFSVTHNHGGPGGYFKDFLHDISILGFVEETFNAIVDGVVRSIVRAHDNIQPARLFYSETKVEDASVNRSPASYLENPEQERNNYEGNLDKTLAQLKILTPSLELIGLINWFAVHPVSMNMTNKLVTSDNAGYAALVLEKAVNPKGTLPGRGKVIAAVGATNMGDVSPNLDLPRCSLTGKRCDIESSRCGRDEGLCYAVGPGKDHFESTQIIGERIANAAISILNERSLEITGPIRVRHRFIDVPEESVPEFDPISRTFKEEKIVKGCIAAMGYSFAAGTTDGTGSLNISQGTTTGNPLLDFVSGLVMRPTQEDRECHAPKPILLATGRTTLPYAWQPRVASVQLVTIGNLAIAAIPGEFTTMAGRRLRDVIKTTLQERGLQNVKVVAAGISNEYIHYITTPEEYQIQRYEGASNIFGPNTLDILLYRYKEVAEAAVTNSEVPDGPTPPDFARNLLSIVTPVVYDSTPRSRNFGDVTAQPRESYSPGDTVSVKFVAGHPRNGLLQESSFVFVEKSTGGDGWLLVATDGSWETKFIWKRDSSLLGTSTVEVQWNIPQDAESGLYRIRHHGHHKNIIGRIQPYQGTTNNFYLSN